MSNLYLTKNIESDITLSSNSNRALSVFFYCIPPNAPENLPYQHDLVCLAEGLQSMGVSIHASANSWWLFGQENSFLFNQDPDIKPEDCSILVFNGIWMRRNKFPKELFSQGRKYITVYIDSDDGNRTYAWDSEARNFDFVLKSHYTLKHSYPSNFHPWYFGLSNRIIEATQNIPNFSDRTIELLVNYRLNNQFPHSVRVAANDYFLPQISSILPVNRSTDAFVQPPFNPSDYLQWIQTGRRHYPAYYQRLKYSAACACFGGYFISDFLSDPSSRLSRLSKRWISKLRLKTQTAVQWDSWRLWEALSAGCVAFHLDFEKYGFHLPVMPKNWEHYIGVDLNNVWATIERLKDEPELLEHISASGRKWAYTHYSPTATATRFLKLILS